MPLALAATALGVELVGAATLMAKTAAEGAGVRQTGRLTFTEQLPGRSSEVVLETDYVNPEDPDGKPPAIRRT